MAASTTIRKNLPYIRHQFSIALGNTTLMVKLLALLVFLCYFLSFNETAVDVISVTPGFLLPPNFRIWTAFTFCFLEIHFWAVVADIITVGLCGKLMEPLWGPFEMFTFFVVVNVSVAVTSVMIYIFAYLVTFNTENLFSIHIHGLAGYIAAVSVSVKQMMPDHVLINTPLGKIRNRNVPLNVLSLSVLLWGVGLLESTYPCMFTTGLLTGWIYLRFLQYHSNGSRGDLAESFTFASFFPNVLQPPVAILCNTIFQCLVKIRICRKPVRKYDVGAPSSITISLPGTDIYDAERRRQIALKALTDRLNKPVQSHWPSLTNDDSPAKHSKTVTFAKSSSSSAVAPSTLTSTVASVSEATSSTVLTMPTSATASSSNEKESEV